MINLPVVGRFGQTRVRIERSGRGGWARHKDLQEAQAVRPNPRGFLVRFSFFQASVEGSHHRVLLRLLHFCTHSTQSARPANYPLDDPRECPDTRNGECMCGATQSNGRIATVLSLSRVRYVCPTACVEKRSGFFGPPLLAKCFGGRM